jgi:hypothetical protein
MFGNEEPAHRGTGKGKLRVMHPDHGDTLVAEWDVADPETIANVGREFNQLQAKGFLAYQFPHEGAKNGEVVKSFDPSVGDDILMTIPLVGG